MSKKTSKKVSLKDKDVPARKAKKVRGGFSIMKVTDSSSPKFYK